MNLIYTNMLFAMGLDRVVFGVVPGVWSLIGGGIVLGCAVWVSVQGKEGGGKSEERRGEDVESGVGAGMQMRTTECERGDDAERRGMLAAHDGESDGEDESANDLHDSRHSSNSSSSSTVHEYGQQARGTA